MVIVLTAFSLHASTCVLQDCGCVCPELREKSLELNVGYRRDYINWKFTDPSLHLVQVALPVLAEKAHSLFKGISPNRFLTKDDIPSFLAGALDAEICKNGLYESSWNNLRMINVGGTARGVTCGNLYARFGGNWAYIVEGKYQPRGLFAGERDIGNDLLGSCGFGSSAYCKRVNGNTWDVSGAVGYQIRSCDDDFSFTPVVGYAYNEIHLHTNRNSFANSNGDLVDQLNSIIHLFTDEIDFTDIRLFGTSNSRFKSYWTGPYLGFDAVYSANCKLNLYTNFEYHWGIYRAKSRNFNDLRLVFDGNYNDEYHIDFDGSNIETFHESCFKHYAFARGLYCNVGGDYNFCECWTGGVKFSWMDWKTFRQGRICASVNNDLNVNGALSLVDNVINLATLGERFEKDTSLESAHWNSYRIEVTVGRDF